MKVLRYHLSVQTGADRNEQGVLDGFWQPVGAGFGPTITARTSKVGLLSPAALRRPGSV